MTLSALVRLSHELNSIDMTNAALGGRILLIQREPTRPDSVRARLTAEGYTVSVIQNGLEGYEKARQGGFDLILLDVMLSGKSGFEIYRDLRRNGIETPVLMLTDRGEVVDREAGLKRGTAKYVLKQVNAAELLQRVETLLRRRSHCPDLRLGKITVDLETNEVTCNCEPVAMSRSEWRLLHYFIDHLGEVISRDELLANVWGLNGYTLSRTVDVHVAGLRKKLEPDPRCPKYLVTVKGVGYRLVT